MTPTTVSEVGPTNATLGTKITPGFGATVYLFEYGPTAAYGQATPVSDSIGADNSSHPVTTVLNGLAPGTTYHARPVAINFGGTTHGADVTFTTPTAPQVVSSSASETSRTATTLRALIRPGFRSTTYHFEYGPTPAYGMRTPESVPIGGDGIAHEAVAVIGGLASGTAYHFRVVATNAVGTVAGPDQAFITQPEAVASTAAGGGSHCDAAKLSHRASRYARRAKQLRRRARKLGRHGGRPGKVKRLRRRARKSAHTAKRMSKAAKRCRRSLRRSK